MIKETTDLLKEAHDALGHRLWSNHRGLQQRIREQIKKNQKLENHQ